MRRLAIFAFAHIRIIKFNMSVSISTVRTLFTSSFLVLMVLGCDAPTVAEVEAQLDYTPVEFVLHDSQGNTELVLEVPRAYLGWTSRNFDLKKAIQLRATMPELRPQLGNQPGSGPSLVTADSLLHRLSITLRAERLSPEWLALLKRQLESTTKANYLRNQSLDVGGLIGYCMAKKDTSGEPRCRNDRKLRWLHAGTDNPNDAPVEIICKEAEPLFQAGCVATTVWRARSIQYSFALAKLPEWEDVQSNAFELVEQFIVAEHRSKE